MRTPVEPLLILSTIALSCEIPRISPFASTRKGNVGAVDFNILPSQTEHWVECSRLLVGNNSARTRPWRCLQVHVYRRVAQCWSYRYALPSRSNDHEFRREALASRTTTLSRSGVPQVRIWPHGIPRVASTALTGAGPAEGHRWWHTGRGSVI